MGSKDKIALRIFFHPVLCRMCTSGEGPEESHVSQPISGTDLGVWRLHICLYLAVGRNRLSEAWKSRCRGEPWMSFQCLEGYSCSCRQWWPVVSCGNRLSSGAVGSWIGKVCVHWFPGSSPCGVYCAGLCVWLQGTAELFWGERRTHSWTSHMQVIDMHLRCPVHRRGAPSLDEGGEVVGPTGPSRLCRQNEPRCGSEQHLGVRVTKAQKSWVMDSELYSLSVRVPMGEHWKTSALCHLHGFSKQNPGLSLFCQKFGVDLKKEALLEISLKQNMNAKQWGFHR